MTHSLRTPCLPLIALLLGAVWAAAPTRAQVVVEPPSLPSGGKSGADEGIAPRLALEAGNAIYRIWVDDASQSDCGAWTAATGPSHPATALNPSGRKNVLFNGRLGNPSTSDTTLRSYDTGLFYRTGPNGGSSSTCLQICDEADAVFVPIETAGPSGLVRTGWRTTWILTDGPAAQRIEFVQEVNVDGPVDGSETVDNTVIRETHRVRNLGTSVFSFGLRKHWDWQIASDDGPAMGDCATPDEACDRSMDLTGDGSRDGFYPNSYTINHDPGIMSCPPGISPLASGCGGNPLYLVAGTVAPPSALVPPPDAPELLQFNNWDLVVQSCWWPSLLDASDCGALGNPSGDDTTIAYFYGLSSGSALQLAPQQERSFTQYVVAATDECPGLVQPPTLSCDAGGPYADECTGGIIEIPLDGTGTSDSGEPPLYAWTTDCPGGSFDDATLEDPILSLISEGCSTTCVVTLTVSDANDPDQSLDCSSTVTVEDSQGPDLNCPPEPLEIECEGGGTTRSHPLVQQWLAQASAFDACSGDSTTVEDDMPSTIRLRSCPTVVPVTFESVDACGNLSSCVQDLILVDTQAPEPLCPPDRNFECGEPVDDQQAWLDSASGSDGCGGASISSELLSSSSPCPFTTTETWLFVATDSCGNTASCEALWSIGDTTAPMVTPPPPSVNECGAPAPISQDDWFAMASADDGCAGPLGVERELVDEQRPCRDTRIETWRFFATDDCGHQGEAFSTWTEQDTMAPEILGVPEDETVACHEVEAPANPSASDLCDPAPDLSMVETREDGSCPGSYRLTRVWTAVDACGNSSERSQVIIVVDLAPPELSGVPADLTVECDAVPPPAEPSAVDACSGATIELLETRVDGACPSDYQLTRTWTATDGCGNSAAESQVITVIDTQAPVLSGVPADLAVDCAEVPEPASPSALDACGGASISFSESRIDGDCPQDHELHRSWTATDDCGNASTQTQVLLVTDMSAPTLSGVPADASVDCSAVPLPASPTAQDDCGAATISFAEVRIDGSCPQDYELHRSWTATDDCGNDSTETQVLLVTDMTAPTLSGVPADASVDCSAVPLPASPTVQDDCGAATISFAEVRIDGSCPQNYELHRSWTATDDCGNASTGTQVVSVSDTTPPVLRGVPADATVECDSVPAPPSPTAVDDCGGATIAFAELRVDSSCPQEYELQRTWTATDDCGNSSSRTQSLSVVDTTPPTFSGVPADETVDCDAVPPPASPEAEDKCGSASLSFVELRIDGPCPHDHQLVRTWTAVDDCGNAASASQVLHVVDETPPELLVPEPLVLECSGPEGVSVDDPRVQAWLSSASASDNCSSPVMVLHDAPATFPIGCPDPILVPVTFTAVDECGNASAATSTVRVIDTTPPVIESVDLPGCLWVPNHRYVCFEDLASRVIATDLCSTELSVRLSACASDQPDEAPEDGDRGGRALGNGDGRSVNDCVVAPDGAAACLRAERQGTDPSGRNYSLLIEVSDACGNTATLPWSVHVPHDQSEHDCEKVDNESMLKKHDPFPWE